MILSDRDLRARLERGDLVIPNDLVARVEGGSSAARGSKYQGQRGPVTSRISRDEP